MKELTTHAVILAGGRGTRFWPRSRTRTPKQLLNIVGKDTMLEQTVARLRPLIPAERIWTVTNSEQAAAVRKQVSAAARRRVLTVTSVITNPMRKATRCWTAIWRSRKKCAMSHER